MPMISVKCPGRAILAVNNSFSGEVLPNHSVSVPAGSGTTYISAYPLEEDTQPVWVAVENDGLLLHLAPCSGRLCRWSDEIYELELCIKKNKKELPPLILNEKKWGASFAGICAGFFVAEDERGARRFFQCEEPIDDFSVLSSGYAALQSGGKLTVVDQEMKAVLSLEVNTFSVENNRLHLRFCPGGMDSYEIRQSYNTATMEPTESVIERRESETELSAIRCFCEAVRLNLKEEALSFLTPELSRDMSFEEIKEFLGPFDSMEEVRYLPNSPLHSVALRYAVDACNFHYLCYEFNIISGGRPLIDDIAQL